MQRNSAGLAHNPLVPGSNPGGPTRFWNNHSTYSKTPRICVRCGIRVIVLICLKFRKGLRKPQGASCVQSGVGREVADAGTESLIPRFTLKNIEERLLRSTERSSMCPTLSHPILRVVTLQAHKLALSSLARDRRLHQGFSPQ